MYEPVNGRMKGNEKIQERIETLRSRIPAGSRDQTIPKLAYDDF